MSKSQAVKFRYKAPYIDDKGNLVEESYSSSYDTIEEAEAWYYHPNKGKFLRGLFDRKLVLRNVSINH